MKKTRRKIKRTLLVLCICLVVLISFSKLGILFSGNATNYVTVTTAHKAFDQSYYVSLSNLSFEGESLGEISDKLNAKFKGSLKGMGEPFARLCMQKGMDPYLLAAISVHETGFGKSNAAMTKYNFGGIMCSGKLCTYSSVEDGISSFINMVYRNYFSKGLTTPEQMHKKYAEGNTWADKVTMHYKALRNQGK